MASVTFDTLKFANRLKEAGVPDRQAEAEAAALSEVLQISLGEIATKEDVRLLKEATKEDMRLLKEDVQRLKEDLRQLEARLTERFDAKLLQLEQRMTIKLGTLMVIVVGAVAALTKIL